MYYNVIYHEINPFITFRHGPMICPQGYNGVQIFSFDMLKNLRRASVLVFTRRRILNPKTKIP